MKLEELNSLPPPCALESVLLYLVAEGVQVAKQRTTQQLRKAAVSPFGLCVVIFPQMLR